MNAHTRFYAERAAWSDAMRHIARDIPDPAEYSRYLPAVEVAELKAAVWTNTGWRFRQDIDPALLFKFRKVGLAYLEDRNLTNFACRVRKVLLADEL